MTITAGLPRIIKTEKSYSFHTSLSCFEGLTVVRKLSRSLRKASGVTSCDEIRWSPTKCDKDEGKFLPKEKEPSKDILQSSSLSNNLNAIGEVNKGFHVSVLDLYSDDESNDASRIGKEPAPIKVSAVSVETENALLSETISQPVINSGMH